MKPTPKSKHKFQPGVAARKLCAICGRKKEAHVG